MYSDDLVPKRILAMLYDGRCFMRVIFKIRNFTLKLVNLKNNSNSRMPQHNTRIETTQIHDYETIIYLFYTDVYILLKAI